MFAIGVGEAEEVELREIASRPTEEHIYNVADFAAISTIKDALVRNVCGSVDGAYSGTRTLTLLNCCIVMGALAYVLFSLKKFMRTRGSLRARLTLA